MPTAQRLASSFRDPSGFVYHRDGVLLRQVNAVYAPHLSALEESGLLAELVDAGLLVAHRDRPLAEAATEGAVRVLEPVRVPFVSYPYCWSFSQLRDAALLTLDVQRRALARDMTLKDASAYNVQFVGTRPVLIDTLSFERLRPGAPWVAYRQFCQHFLAPLALMSVVDVRLGLLLRQFMDGVPLDLASRMLPWRTRLRPGLLMHIHLHASSQRRHADTSGAPGASDAKGAKGAKPGVAVTVSLAGLQGLVDSLEAAVRGLSWQAAGTEWADYETQHGYEAAAHETKKQLVAAQLAVARPRVVWDLGANTGTFSRVALDAGAERVVAFDVDPAAVDRAYRRLAEAKEQRILPLVMDLVNPSPSLGWAHAERPSLAARAEADCVLALALVHHLAIGNNVPLPDIAAFLAALAPWVVLEFVPKQDPQTQRLLRSREDVFATYDAAGFEAAVVPHFEIVRRDAVVGTERTLYLLRRR